MHEAEEGGGSTKKQRCINSRAQIIPCANKNGASLCFLRKV